MTELVGSTSEDPGCTSERMAASVGTHPVVVRRILGSLRQAGLVSSQPGPGGGWTLTRDPTAMTLLDIYRAVEDEPVLPLHQPSHCCPIAACMRDTLNTVFDQAETAMERTLASVTLASIVASIRDSAVGRHVEADQPSGSFTVL